MDRIKVQFKQPGEYESLRQIRRARKDLRQLLDALEVRETEIYQERSHIWLSEELILQAKSLHDRLCARHHVEKPDYSQPNQCGLQVAERWNHVLKCNYPFDDLTCDDQWHWINMATRMAMSSF